jgi:hypothetical protein
MRVVVEKVLAAESGVRYLVCVTGQGACPPGLRRRVGMRAPLSTAAANTSPRRR